MRWEEERYVRVYTRDTTEWSMLSWEARALFVEVLRKVDRAGTLNMGRHGLRGLAALIRYPAEVVERAMPELLDDGCIVIDGSVLTVPNYVIAQEAKKSDAARKREQRERDMVAASSPTPEAGHQVTIRDTASQSVTESHEPSRAVTPSHDRSRLVTPSLAEPSLAEPSHPPSEGTRAPARELAALRLDDATSAVLRALEAQAVTRAVATTALAQRLASHCREHGHSGQWSLAEVLVSIEQAITKLADGEAGGAATAPRDVARFVAGCVRAGPVTKGSRSRSGAVDMGGQPMSTHWKPVEATPEAIAALPFDPVLGL